MLLPAEILGKMLASPGITVKSANLVHSLFLQIELWVSVCGHISARLSWMVQWLASKKGDCMMY